jgi:hypothetical protein
MPLTCEHFLLSSEPARDAEVAYGKLCSSAILPIFMGHVISRENGV